MAFQISSEIGQVSDSQILKKILKKSTATTTMLKLAIMTKQTIATAVLYWLVGGLNGMAGIHPIHPIPSNPLDGIRQGEVLSTFDANK